MVHIRRMTAAVLCICLLCASFTGVYALPERADRVLAQGIDVSRWQGDVDFDKIAAAGIDFVILRVGYSGAEDLSFDTYYDGAKAAGLKVGAYLYSYAKNEADAKEDAHNAALWLSGKKLEYPVYFDIEDKVQESLSIAQRTDLCLTFAAEIGRYGWLAGVYANRNWFDNYLDRSRLTGMPLWLAQWTDDARPSGIPPAEYGMWQYTSDGSVDGVPGRVDRDVCYADYPAYIVANGLCGYGNAMYDPELPFTDVPRTKWYYESVKYTYDHALVNGMSASLFAPDTPVTRGMFVTLLGRMSEVDQEEYAQSVFLDVDINRYYGAYTAWAYQNGIADGVGHDLFAPDEQITREQMCKMIAGYLKYLDVGAEGQPKTFADDAEIAGWA